MKTVVFQRNGAFSEYMFKDLTDREDTLNYKVEANSCSGAKDLIRFIHKSRTIARYIELPFKEVWFDMKPIREFADQHTYFIFINEALAFMDLGSLKKIRKEYPDNPMVLIMVDSMNAHSLNMEFSRKLITGFQWDLVLSFDEDDCRQYGYKPLGLRYYSEIKYDESDKGESDLYFIGGYKPNDKRYLTLMDVFSLCQEKDVKTDFTLCNIDHSPLEGIKYSEKDIPYSDIIQSVHNANCILEILQDGQKRHTARYFEAVVCNKKLLTNNPNTYELPYYDPRYMKVFKTISDIDCDWIRETENIDYGYKGDFSPASLPELISGYLEG